MSRKWVTTLTLLGALGPLITSPPARGGEQAPRLTLKGHTNQIHDLAFAPDGKTLVSTGWFGDNTVRLWDVETGKTRAVLKPGGVESQIEFSPDGATLFCHCNKPNRVKRGHKSDFQPYTDLICSWDLRDLTRPSRLLYEGGLDSDRIWCLAMSPKGTVLAVVVAGRTYLLEPPDWKFGRSLETSGPDRAVPASFPKGFATVAAFSPDGTTLAAQGYPAGVALWDHKAGRLVTTLFAQGNPLVDSVQDLAFSPDGKYLAALSRETRANEVDLVVWYLLANMPIRQIKLPRGRFFWGGTLVYSPDGALLAAGDLSGTLHLWLTPDFREQTVKIHVKMITALRFSPDGKTLASGSNDGLVKLWDVERMIEHTRGDSPRGDPR